MAIIGRVRRGGLLLRRVYPTRGNTKDTLRTLIDIRKARRVCMPPPNSCPKIQLWVRLKGRILTKQGFHSHPYPKKHSPYYSSSSSRRRNMVNSMKDSFSKGQRAHRRNVHTHSLILQGDYRRLSRHPHRPRSKINPPSLPFPFYVNK